MPIIDCGREFAPSILAIFNEAIANSTALYDYQPRPPESMTGWFDVKEKRAFPVVGVVENGQLLAFGSYGTFRAWPAYKYSVEHSVYVEKSHRGRGLGKLVLAELIRRAQRQNYHCLIAGIDSANQVSIRLHQALGFTECGTIRQAGFKFGRWLDLAFYQLLLATPEHPVDG